MEISATLHTSGVREKGCGRVMKGRRWRRKEGRKKERKEEERIVLKRLKER